MKQTIHVARKEKLGFKNAKRLREQAREAQKEGGPRKMYTKDFKIAAIQFALEGKQMGSSLHQSAKDLDIGVSTLHNWIEHKSYKYLKDEFKAENKVVRGLSYIKSSFAPIQNQKIEAQVVQKSEIDGKMQSINNENIKLIEENAFLKKMVNYFSNEYLKGKKENDDN